MIVFPISSAPRKSSWISSVWGQLSSLFHKIQQTWNVTLALKCHLHLVVLLPYLDLYDQPHFFGSNARHLFCVLRKLSSLITGYTSMIHCRFCKRNSYKPSRHFARFINKQSLISNLVECIFLFLYKKVTWNPFCHSGAVHGNSFEFISATKTVPHLVKGHDWKQQSTKAWKQPQTEFPIRLSDGLHEPQRDKYHVHILPPVAVCWIILMNHIKFLDNICHLPKLQFSAVKDQPVHLFRYL